MTDEATTATLNDPGSLEDVKLMTVHEVMRIARVSRTTIYDWMAQGRFPRPLKLAGKVVRWREDEVLTWFKHLSRAERIGSKAC